ncbi:MAG: hypothetical protein D6798_10665 [Deltaproteobacteria bacterium]|nr:MAG: hypothetical protein D6798_10665 [Deltaproteobacteria bacterium]
MRITSAPLLWIATTGLLAGAALVWRGASSDASATPVSATTRAAITATPPTDHARRAFQLAALAPDLPPTAVDASLERSDAWVDDLRDEGVDDIGAELAQRLEAAGPTDAQARAFYDAHRDLFGQRSFHVSRHAVDQLYRIRMVRAELDQVAVGP